LIKCWLKQNLKKDTAVAAPTGIAAFNRDGLTVHRLLQLSVELLIIILLNINN